MGFILSERNSKARWFVIRQGTQAFVYYHSTEKVSRKYFDITNTCDRYMKFISSCNIICDTLCVEYQRNLLDEISRPSLHCSSRYLVQQLELNTKVDVFLLQRFLSPEYKLLYRTQQLFVVVSRLATISNKYQNTPTLSNDSQSLLKSKLRSKEYIQLRFNCSLYVGHAKRGHANKDCANLPGPTYL
ncbi:hypothetical protein WN51_00096 [Melipona quadrifasciata]|uniref:Uncharacterized protein n=1 Tax=Melipona quadrifasciata TaxID=166423 RepID=A0A0M9ADZ1_9HYME|nr:hypothetical protein WN51_00096 [Melipona quadrifasciata]